MWGDSGLGERGEGEQSGTVCIRNQERVREEGGVNERDDGRDFFSSHTFRNIPAVL